MSAQTRYDIRLVELALGATNGIELAGKWQCRQIEEIHVLHEQGFQAGLTADKSVETEELKFWPILVAQPSDAVRDGPYVYPKGPYPHIQASRGRAEAMMWAVERKDGGRGFGFTGGHFHDNWGNDDFRKTVLNALLWLAKVEVPEDGVQSAVTKADLDANLDPKRRR